MTPETIALLAIIGFVFASRLLLWLVCRATAEQCPRCGSRWQTEALGEWDGHGAWTCHNCAHYWTVIYRIRL